MEKMLFCHYHYEKTKHPKFYDSACELLAKGKDCAFTSQNEVPSPKNPSRSLRPSLPPSSLVRPTKLASTNSVYSTKKKKNREIRGSFFTYLQR